MRGPRHQQLVNEMTEVQLTNIQKKIDKKLSKSVQKEFILMCQQQFDASQSGNVCLTTIGRLVHSIHNNISFGPFLRFLHHTNF
jgi:hypothetical protein